MKLIKQAIKDGYLVINEREDSIIYLPNATLRKLGNPEEKVQMETYVQLIYEYKYPPDQLKVSQKVQIGSSLREADIVVYKDANAKDPFIVVECKKEGVGDQVFEAAIDQGFSYAAATNAEYVWATSGDKNAYFEVWDKAIYERERNRLDDIPAFGQKPWPNKNNESKTIFSKVSEDTARQGKQNTAPKPKRPVYSPGFFRRNPILTDTVIYILVLLVFAAIFSKLAVAYKKELFTFTEPLIQALSLKSYNWVYNLIALLAACMSLLFGGIFMRSHKFFNTSSRRKRTTYILLALILFAPAWYMGASNSDPYWWNESNMGIRKELTYLWPYLKSLPFQFVLIYGLIWLIGRSKSGKK